LGRGAPCLNVEGADRNLLTYLLTYFFTQVCDGTVTLASETSVVEIVGSAVVHKTSKTFLKPKNLEKLKNLKPKNFFLKKHRVFQPCYIYDTDIL